MGLEKSKASEKARRRMLYLNCGLECAEDREECFQAEESIAGNPEAGKIELI